MLFLSLKATIFLEALKKKQGKNIFSFSLPNQHRVSSFSTDLSMVLSKDQRMVEMSFLADLQSSSPDQGATWILRALASSLPHSALFPELVVYGITLEIQRRQCKEQR